MSKTKININYDTQGETTNLYAIIRRVSDGYVWDVAAEAFETWNDGSIGDYDLPLVDQGGDAFQVSFPAAVPDGTQVIVNIYYRRGATAATTDYLVRSIEWLWNGSGLVNPAVSAESASSVTISATALTTLAGVKRQLGISSSAYDTILTELINAASEKIETIAGRKFAAGNYVEHVDSFGAFEYVVKNWPIIRLRAAGCGSASMLTVGYSGSDIFSVVTVLSTGVRLVSMDAAGTETATDLTYASNPTVSTLCTAIQAVSGWSATYVTDNPSRWLKPYTYDCLGGDVGLVGPSTISATVSCDSDIGSVRFDPGAYSWDSFGSGGFAGGSRLAGGTDGVMIDYRGGYETIPADIDQLCREIVQQMWGIVGKNTALQSESLGSYSYTLANQVDVTSTQLNMLANYSTAAIA